MFTADNSINYFLKRKESKTRQLFHISVFYFAVNAKLIDPPRYVTKMKIIFTKIDSLPWAA